MRSRDWSPSERVESLKDQRNFNMIMDAKMGGKETWKIDWHFQWRRNFHVISFCKTHDPQHEAGGEFMGVCVRDFFIISIAKAPAYEQIRWKANISRREKEYHGVVQQKSVTGVTLLRKYTQNCCWQKSYSQFCSSRMMVGQWTVLVL